MINGRRLEWKEPLHPEKVGQDLGQEIQNGWIHGYGGSVINVLRGWIDTWVGWKTGGRIQVDRWMNGWLDRIDKLVDGPIYGPMSKLLLINNAKLSCFDISISRTRTSTSLAK